MFEFQIAEHERAAVEIDDGRPWRAPLARRVDTHGHTGRRRGIPDLDAGVVIGVAFGGQAEVILEQSNATELLGVDGYEPSASASNPASAAAAAAAAVSNTPSLTAPEFENLFWYVMGRLSRFGPRYNHVRGSSAQAAQVLNVEMDFVLLDTDRTHASVFQDLNLWFPKLRNGGVIGGQLARLPGAEQGGVGQKVQAG